MFDNLRIHRYVETPKCPKCGSSRTGIYIYSPGFSFSSFSASFINIKEEANRLKKGQIIRYTDSPVSESGYNLFCDNCNVSWLGRYNISYLSKTEIEDKLQEKELSEEEIKEKYRVNKKLKRKSRGKTPLGRFFSTFVYNPFSGMNFKREKYEDDYDYGEYDEDDYDEDEDYDDED